MAGFPRGSRSFRPDDTTRLGLIGQYAIDNNVTADLSGNNNTASIIGTVFIQPSPINTAISVGSGSNNGLALPTAANISVFTYSAFIQVGSLGSFQAIFGCSSASNGPELRINQTTGTLSFLKQNVALIGTSAGAVAVNVWTHVAVSYDGTNVAFYINGCPSGSASSAQTFTFANQTIGWAGNNENFGGNISDARIYNRVLSPAEVAGIFIRTLAPNDGLDQALLSASSTVVTSQFPGWVEAMASNVPSIPTRAEATADVSRKWTPYFEGVASVKPAPLLYLEALENVRPSPALTAETTGNLSPSRAVPAEALAGLNRAASAYLEAIASVKFSYLSATETLTAASLASGAPAEMLGTPEYQITGDSLLPLEWAGVIPSQAIVRAEAATSVAGNAASLDLGALASVAPLMAATAEAVSSAFMASRTYAEWHTNVRRGFPSAAEMLASAAHGVPVSDEWLGVTTYQMMADCLAVFEIVGPVARKIVAAAEATSNLAYRSIPMAESTGNAKATTRVAGETVAAVLRGQAVADETLVQPRSPTFAAVAFTANINRLAAAFDEYLAASTHVSQSVAQFETVQEIREAALALITVEYGYTPLLRARAAAADSPTTIAYATDIQQRKQNEPMSNTYTAGQTTTLQITLTDPVTGIGVSASAIKLRIMDPTMTETDVTTGFGIPVSNSFGNPAPGVYAYSLLVEIPGRWYYRWEITSPFFAAAEGFLEVSATKFTSPQ